MHHQLLAEEKLSFSFSYRKEGKQQQKNPECNILNSISFPFFHNFLGHQTESNTFPAQKKKRKKERPRKQKPKIKRKTTTLAPKGVNLH